MGQKVNDLTEKKQNLINIFISAFFSLASALGYWLFVSVKLPTPFLLNDQLVFREIASGAYTGTPDGHLIYILYPLGWILAKLYSISSVVDWYGLIMLSTFPVCCFLVTFRITKATNKVYNKLLLAIITALVFMVCTPYFAVQNEYTVNAGMYAVAGLILFANKKEKEDRVFNVLAILCFTMSLWMRKNVFIMVVPFLGFCVYAVEWQERARLRARGSVSGLAV